MAGKLSAEALNALPKKSAQEAIQKVKFFVFNIRSTDFDIVHFQTLMGISKMH